ncbi:hypothetical protein M885DRAFT_540388 [Pelagophyceae sp. CCMP2097]|nr:hypothetical protein M885DRAFT_540388 [Pelagophyceae sp. CCMP2097]
MARFLVSLALLPVAARALECKAVAEAGYSYELELHAAYSMAWRLNPLNVSFLLKLNMTDHDSAWAGLGWSKTGRMFGSDAVCGVYESHSRSYVRQYYLGKYDKDKVKVLKKIRLDDESVEVVNGTALLRIEFSKARQDVEDLGSGFIWAFGYNGYVEMHQDRGGYDIDLENCDVKPLVYKGPDVTMIIAHGAMMMLAFAVLMPIGILTANKKIRPEGDAWLKWHVLAHVLAVVAAAVGFGIIYAAVDDPAAQRDHGFSRHSKLGTAVLLATVIQFLMGAFRPGKDSAKRRVFHVIHKMWGWGLHIVSAVTLGFGIWHAKQLRYLDADAFVAFSIIYLFLMTGGTGGIGDSGTSVGGGGTVHAYA